VDDSLASLELMIEVFTDLKAEVNPVSDSDKAVDMINQEKFDGILTPRTAVVLSCFHLN
jgi:CheY-like chemotaxis protein